MGEIDLRSDARERYRAACERERLIRECWEEMGRPMTTVRVQTELAHPLLGAMREAEGHAERLGRRLASISTGSQPGRPSQRSASSDEGRPGILRAVREPDPPDLSSSDVRS